MAVLITSSSQMPGRGATSPKPVMRPNSTQPDQVATAAGVAMRSRGQRVMVDFVWFWRSSTGVDSDR
ncbi:hypothetical protein AC529_16830 [Thermobifida cellulosilytica TB100]|uniref:Uncharacterized protein n=1 Tax=Thermobifida cellulosilytica TB100 TaxID=665004 RepID=A0A147KE77_THECS|nr:hypothetical protein AC529_16830 [Thermobifida cellulosilytica TB100]